MHGLDHDMASPKKREDSGSESGRERGGRGRGRGKGDKEREGARDREGERSEERNAAGERGRERDTLTCRDKARTYIDRTLPGTVSQALPQCFLSGASLVPHLSRADCV